jgi:hypothetical protein
MKKALLYFFGVLMTLSSCSKSYELTADKGTETTNPETGFTRYTIRQGQHYADQNPYKALEVAALSFTVRFDSSAIYTSQLPINQLDINKLYGFSDNNASHHDFSARFGWRWSDNALRLFAYIYNDGHVDSKELTTISIGANIQCRLEVTERTYIFTVDGNSFTMPRKSSTSRAIGYQLYPYFGGDEPAPHEIRIWIKA